MHGVVNMACAGIYLSYRGDYNYLCISNQLTVGATIVMTFTYMAIPTS